VQSTSASCVGCYEGGDGQVTIQDPGSSWVTEEDLSIGAGGGKKSPGGTGLVSIQSGGLLDVGGDLTLWPDGTLQFLGGSLNVGGDIVMAGGSFEGAGQANASLSGFGSLNARGGTLTIGDPESSNGVNFDGEITVEENATLVLQDLDGARLGSSTSLAAGSTLSADTIELRDGRALCGSGTVSAQLLNLGGVLCSGPGSERLTIEGNYTQSDTSTIQIEIGPEDLNQATGIEIFGVAEIAGTLSLSLAEGFELDEALTLPILSASFLDGRFDQVLVDGAAAEVSYTTQGISVTLTPGCPWDLDDTGDVGIRDLLMILRLWGTSPQGPPDFDNDGSVNVDDLMEVISHWGMCP